jgi:hypothetical protein
VCIYIFLCSLLSVKSSMSGLCLPGLALSMSTTMHDSDDMNDDVWCCRVYIQQLSNDNVDDG